LFFLYQNDTLSKKSFTTEELFKTDNVEGIINYICYKKCRFSFNKKDVVVGKNGFLFLGNYHARVIDKSRGTFYYHKDDIDTWTDKLKSIQQWYEDRGMEFVVVVAPNKHTICKANLPQWINPDVNTVTDDIVRQAVSKHIHMLDLRPILSERSDQLLYMKTDSHWNKKGASIGFTETLNYIDQTYDKRYAHPHYVLKKTTREGGDLSRLLKIQALLPSDYEKVYDYVFEQLSMECSGNIIRSTGRLTSCDNQKNSKTRISSTSHYSISNSALNKEKLLLVGDSFTAANFKLFNTTFNTVWKIHYDLIQGRALGTFVLKHKPDIVIYQIVERALYNNNIIIPLE